MKIQISLAFALPKLYRGVTKGTKYIGFNWYAQSYLTSDLVQAVYYGRGGTIDRIEVPSGLNIVNARDKRVREIEKAKNPAEKARVLHIDAIINTDSSREGKVTPREFIIFSSIKLKKIPLTDEEQARINEVKGYKR